MATADTWDPSQYRRVETERDQPFPDLFAFVERVPGGSVVVLSNAALHWVPDHRAVLGRWRAALRPGGQLAVQVPANFDHPSHAVVAEVADGLGLSVEPDPVAI